MLRIISLGVLSLFVIGCGNNPAPKSPNKVVKVVKKVIDPCEANYQKCSAECKVTTLNEADWKKMACETKCKTIYAGCKAKQKTIEGYHYIKEKVTK